MMNVKKAMAIILCLILCASVCACRKNVPQDSSGEVEIVGNNNGDFDNDSTLDDSSQVDVSSNNGNGQSVSSGKNNNSSNNGSSSNGNQNQNSSSGSQSNSSQVSNKDHTLSLKLESWHPGVYGYDASYTLLPFLDGEMPNSGNVTYKASDSAVKFKGNVVTIPSSVRQKGNDVTVTLTEKTTGLKTDIKIQCKKWDVTFNDEFNGTEIDSTKWSTFEEGSGGTISMQWRDNAFVQDGKLNLIVKKEEKTFNGKTVQYTQGGISTKGKFDQVCGLFTASMKIPKTPSLNSAFWLLPGGAYGKAYMTYDKDETTKGLSEIDIVEASYAWNNTYCIGEHFYDTANEYEHSSKGKSYVGINKDLAENYVEYSCAWLEDTIYYYADGILLYTDDAVVSKGGIKPKDGLPAYLIFTLGVYGPDNTWCGDYSELENATFPITLYVDYARVYK